MKFSLLHPSRSRPHKSVRTIEKWLDCSASTDYELIVSVDESDPSLDQYKSFYNKGRFANPNVKVIVNNNRSAVDAINNAAKASTGEVMIVVSDDTDTIKGWDRVLSQAIGTHTDFVLKVYDGIQEWIITMPIMDRVYYNRFGYVYYPEYKHMFCDTHLTHVADALGKIIFRNDIIIPHLHYSIRKSEKDEVSEKADQTFNEGRNIYTRLLKQNLLLDKDVNIWNLSKHARTHLQWVRQAIR